MPHKLAATTILLTLSNLAIAQSCNVQACTRQCSLWDGVWNSCSFDFINKGYKTLASCVCTFSGPDATVAALDQCVLCDQEGLGINPLTRYQSWDAICETYKYSGQDTAESYANAQSTAVVQAFSQTILPALQSSYCGSAPR